MKKQISQKEFEDIVTVVRDIEHILQSIVSTMGKMNRDGKIEDYNFSFLHKDIELIFRSNKAK